MKSTIFYLSIIILLFSCKNKNEYTIHGSIKGEPTEKWIYLDKYMATSIAMDSALIVDGAFEFKGSVDFPEVYGLSYHPTKSAGIFLIFAEPADLKVVIDLESWDFKSTVTGGLINGEYNKLEQPSREIMDLFDERADAIEERQKAIDEQINKLGVEYQKQNLEYIKNNPGSPISIFLLSKIFPMFNVKEQGEYLEAFDPAIHNTSIYKMLYKEYEEMISPEKSTPSLTLSTAIEPLSIDLKDAPIIKTLGKQNPGKHLFIDVWGTWCGPCIQEFPAIRNLISSMESEDIAFVYLCLDCEEAKWKDMIQNEELKGQHYLIGNKLLDRFFDETESGIRGVPKYVIVNKTGNLINDDAPKPSSGKLEEILISI